MLLLPMLSFWLLPVFADQQCLEQGACAAQCAASLRVCIADCSPPPLEQIEEEKGSKVYNWLLIYSEIFRHGRNSSCQRGYCRGKH